MELAVTVSPDPRLVVASLPARVCLVGLLGVGLLAACDGGVSGAVPDGGGGGGQGGACSNDSECDDSLYCNGLERCDRGSCRRGEAADCDDGVGCTRDTCDETADQCQHIPNHAVCDGALCDLQTGCTDRLCGGADDCNDDVFCNGVERCNEGHCAAGAVPSCDDGDECTMDLCAEDRRACSYALTDRDGDGAADQGCAGGTDCDDADRDVGPRAHEVCDDARDNDCDGQADCEDQDCANAAACGGGGGGGGGAVCEPGYCVAGDGWCDDDLPCCPEDADCGGGGGGGGACEPGLCVSGDGYCDEDFACCGYDEDCAYAGGGVCEPGTCVEGDFYCDEGIPCCSFDPDCWV